MTFINRYPVLAFIALLIWQPGVANAQDDSKLSLSFGLFVTDWDSKARLDIEGGPGGTPVDLEKDLGLTVSDSVFRLDGNYRFTDRHRIDFSAFSLSRSASKELERDITWNGTTYPVSSTVSSDFKLDVYKVAYTLSLATTEKGYVGVTGGLYIADIDVRLSSTGIAEDDRGAATAPLPVIGLRGEYALADKWTFRASGEFFALKYDNYDGSLIDLYAGIDYQLFDRAAIGVGLNSVRIDLDVTDKRLTGKLDWRYDGGLLFLKFDF
jgi:hypothetical protein